ncbi:zeta toxin family protein [Streptomyces sp. NPDC059999]|uniref:zeta toxin family protein n=1 Tax=Streptomyces sp. NPDC059999 TaxID=3347030 RepID=UPI003678012D
MLLHVSLDGALGDPQQLGDRLGALVLDAGLEAPIADLAQAIATTQIWRTAGYRVEVVALATSEAEAQLSALDRYLTQVYGQGAGRSVSWGNLEQRRISHATSSPSRRLRRPPPPPARAPPARAVVRPPHRQAHTPRRPHLGENTPAPCVPAPRTAAPAPHSPNETTPRVPHRTGGLQQHEDPATWKQATDSTLRFPAHHSSFRVVATRSEP